MDGFSGSMPAVAAQGLVLILPKYAEMLMPAVCCS